MLVMLEKENRSQEELMGKWTLSDPCKFFIWTAASRGARDAKKNRPVDDDYVVFETERGNAENPGGNGSGRELNGDRSSFNDVIDIKELLKEQRIALLALYEVTLIQLTEMSIDRLEGQLWKRKTMLTAKVLRAMHCLGHALAAYQKIWELHKNKEFRQPYRIIPRWAYFPALVVFGVSEFVFNLMAFEGLNAGNLETIIIAAGLGVMTPLVAHCLGTALRQWPKTLPQDLPRWPNILVMELLVGVLLLAFTAVAWLRGEFMEQELQALGISMTTNTYWLSQLSFFSINAFVFAASLALAFFSHDADRERERIYWELKRTELKVAKCWRRWARSATKLNRLIAVLGTRKDAFQDNCLAAIAEFRDHNIRNRPNGGPWWFKTAVTRCVFRKRDFGRLLEDQPPPLNEILGTIERGELLIWSAEELTKGNGADEVST